VSNFIVQAVGGDPITIYGDGSQTRSFCYVSDMVEGLVRMMESDDFTGPVNLGNPKEFSIRQLAELVVELTHPESDIVYKPLPQDDPLQRCPDITLAKERLKWEPVVPLKEGLEKTIEYFRQVL
jgi:UDP-glucuronate decarboxylase